MTHSLAAPIIEISMADKDANMIDFYADSLTSCPKLSSVNWSLSETSMNC